MPHLDAGALVADADGLEFLRGVLDDGAAPSLPARFGFDLRAVSVRSPGRVREPAPQTDEACDHLLAEPV